MNRYDLEGRLAVVTGAAQGIGLAVARRLAASNARVAIWDRDEGLAREAAASLGEGHHAFAVDVADEGAVARATAATLAALGPAGALVTSAGIAGANGRVVDYDPAEWRRVIEVNLTGTFLCARALLPQMEAAGFGRVVLIASVAGKEGNPNAGAYSASKAGVLALAKSLGKEHAAQDIAVNAVTPAAARTRILDQLTPQFVDYMLSKIPRARFLEVDELASLIAWLCSPENSFSTGAVFDASGGRATY